LATTDAILLVIAGIIFLGFFGEILFKRRGIPQTLSLILLGLTLKAVGLIPQNALNFLVPIISQLTLAMILFDLGMHLDFRQTLNQGASAVTRSALYMLLSITAVFLFFHFYLGWGPYQSLLLGSIIGGETTAVVVPYVARRLSRGDDGLVANLTLESAFNSIVLIILFFVFLNGYQQSVPLDLTGLQAIALTFTAQLSVGIVAGLVAGLAWIRFSKFMRSTDYLYIATIGYVLAIYALVGELGGSGILAVLTLGVVFLNLGTMLPGYRLPEGTAGYIGSLQNEITFFLKTFFFVFLGLELSLQSFLDLETWILAGVVILVLLSARFVSTYSVDHRKDRETKRAIYIMVAQGLTPAVLATILLGSSVVGSGEIVLIATLVIVLTNMVTAIGAYVLNGNSAIRDSGRVAGPR
jgi:cell volume regulation protein A